MTIQLYAKDGHECIMFHDLVQADADAVQSNQFIVCHGDHMAVIDPGGMMTYNAIFLRRMQCFPKSQVDYIMASHADPDVVASLNRWLVQTTCKLVIPAVWSRFVPHFCTHSIENRLVPVPDAGGILPLGEAHIIVLPAHFLHSEGNFQFYDPISKILFSGDLGASLRCRHWERSQASAAPSSVRTFRPGPTAWWSLVIDSTCQVCATQPRPGSPPLPPHTNCPHTPPHPGPAPPQPTAPAHRLPDRRRHGRGHSARPGARPSGRGHSTPSETAIPSPHARDAPGWKKVSPHTQNVPRHASELSETRRTLVASNAARLPLSRWHRCPRMATDSTTTVDTTVIRAALQTIVTIGDS